MGELLTLQDTLHDQYAEVEKHRVDASALFLSSSRGGETGEIIFYDEHGAKTWTPNDWQFNSRTSEPFPTTSATTTGSFSDASLDTLNEKYPAADGTDNTRNLFARRVKKRLTTRTTTCDTFLPARERGDTSLPPSFSHPPVEIEKLKCSAAGCTADVPNRPGKQSLCGFHRRCNEVVLECVRWCFYCNKAQVRTKQPHGVVVHVSVVFSANIVAPLAAPRWFLSIDTRSPFTLLFVLDPS